ncbi:MAG: PfkB family carbohydrate kinase [Promethearchaeota archaeon]
MGTVTDFGGTNSGWSGSFDLVLVGHIARDQIVDHGVETGATGGAVYYGSVVARRLGCRVAVVTRLARRDFGILDELEREGVVLFPTESASTSGIRNVYTTDDRNRRECHPLGFAGPFRLDEIPRLDSKYVVLGPIIAGEFDLEFLEGISSRITGSVALDVQGFVRVREGDDLVFKNWEDRREGLAHVDVLKADDAEVEAITGRVDLLEGARELAAMGPKEILVTRSDGLLVHAGGKTYHAPFVAENLSGRTGRGDTAFNSYLAWRVSHGPKESCRLAGAVTSMKLSRPGALKATIDEVRVFLEKYPRETILE